MKILYGEKRLEVIEAHFADESQEFQNDLVIESDGYGKQKIIYVDNPIIGVSCEITNAGCSQWIEYR